MAALLDARLGRYELLTALLDELRLHTVLVAEDVHWADEATLDVLRIVGRKWGPVLRPDRRHANHFDGAPERRGSHARVA